MPVLAALEVLFAVMSFYWILGRTAARQKWTKTLRELSSLGDVMSTKADRVVG